MDSFLEKVLLHLHNGLSLVSVRARDRQAENSVLSEFLCEERSVQYLESCVTSVSLLLRFSLSYLTFDPRWSTVK